MDFPAWILDAVVRLLPDELGEWGSAMRAELAYIRHPLRRWQFVAGCARVALFPPDRGGSLMRQMLKNRLPVFGAAAVLALLYAGSAALIHGRDQTIRLGVAAIGVLGGGWLALALVFTLLGYRRQAGKPLRMRDWLMRFGGAGVFGLVAVSPFAFMEIWNNPGIRSGQAEFPFALFHGMLLFPTVLILAAGPIVRGVRAGESVMTHPTALVLRIAFLALVGAAWLLILGDQMPCFLGIPGCD